MKNRKLTIEEHQRIGAELARIRSFLITLSFRVSNTYGETDRAGHLAFALNEKTDRLLSEMENHMLKDCPDTASLRYYYPEHTLKWTFDMHPVVEDSSAS